jgi:hypothetical protein
LDVEGVAGDGEGGVVDGVRGGLLAFDGGEGGDERGLESVEVFGVRGRGFDELRAVGLGLRGWFGGEGEGAGGGIRG